MTILKTAARETREDLAAVVFVSNKFISFCVIFLVIAREIFLLQSDCSAITEVHENLSPLNLSLL